MGRNADGSRRTIRMEGLTRFIAACLLPGYVWLCVAGLFWSLWPDDFVAGEDIGLGDPMGLVVANAAAQAFEYVGMPDGVYPIVEATLYLATAPKSNSAGAYFKAYAKIEEEGKVDVPRHLQDSNRDAKGLGHVEGFIYPHEHEGHHVGQQYLPDAVLGTYFYSPSEEGYEAAVKERLARWREAQRRALNIGTTAEVPDLPMDEIIAIKRKMAK